MTTSRRTSQAAQPRGRSPRVLFVLLVSVMLVAGSVSAAPAAPRPAAVGGGIALVPSSGVSPPMTMSIPTGPTEAFSGSAVGSNLLGTGGNQVAVGALNGCVYVYELGNLALAPVCFYTGNGAVQATPVLTDLDGDGYTDLVTANAGNGYVQAFRGGPGGLASTPFFSKNTTVYATSPGVFATPAVGDLDGDGRPEIIATTWNAGVFAWHLDGSLVQGFPRFLYDTLWSSPVLRDLDNDGQPEIIFGGDMDNYPGQPYPYGGMIWVLRGNGTDVPGFPKNIPKQVVWSTPAVGDVNANGVQDIVFGTGLYFPDTGHHVYALDSGGYALPGWSAAGAPGVNVGSQVMAAPALGRLVNGDARLYTAVVTSDGFTVVLNPDGSQRWASCDDWSGTCPHPGQHHGSAVIADVDGDGQQDVVSFAEFKLKILNGNTGATEAQDGNANPCCPNTTFAPAAAPTVTRLGSDTWITVHALYDANGNGRRDNGDRDRLMAWKIANVPQGRFDWPTFKQNQRRTGSAIDLTAPTRRSRRSRARRHPRKSPWLGPPPTRRRPARTRPASCRSMSTCKTARDRGRGGSTVRHRAAGGQHIHGGLVAVRPTRSYLLPPRACRVSCGQHHAGRQLLRRRSTAARRRPNRSGRRMPPRTTVTRPRSRAHPLPDRACPRSPRDGGDPRRGLDRGRLVACTSSEPHLRSRFRARSRAGTSSQLRDERRWLELRLRARRLRRLAPRWWCRAASAATGSVRTSPAASSCCRRPPRPRLRDTCSTAGAGCTPSARRQPSRWRATSTVRTSPRTHARSRWSGRLRARRVRRPAPVRWCGEGELDHLLGRMGHRRRFALIKGAGAAGYVFDGYGGVSPFGGAPSVPTTRYWGFNIGRAFTISP